MNVPSVFYTYILNGVEKSTPDNLRYRTEKNQRMTDTASIAAHGLPICFCRGSGVHPHTRVRDAYIVLGAFSNEEPVLVMQAHVAFRQVSASPLLKCTTSCNCFRVRSPSLTHPMRYLPCWPCPNQISNCLAPQRSTLREPLQ